MKLPLLLLSPLVLSACHFHWQRSATIVEEGGVRVELERAIDDGQPFDLGFAQPVTLRADALAEVLGELRYEVDVLIGENERKVVLEPTSAGTLARALVRALAQASSTERVRFAIEQAETLLGLLPSSTLTRGVAFLPRPGELEIAFDFVRARPDPDSNEDAWGDPTRRIFSQRHLYLPEGVQRGTFQERSHKQWIRITRLGVFQLMPAEPSPPEPTSPSPPSAPLTEEQKQSRLDYLDELYRSGALSIVEYQKQRKALEDL